MKTEFSSNIPPLNNEQIVHLNRQIPPVAHTPMYNFHKYWSRKTWNVVGEFINTYCPENGIVLDPFGGSGVTAIEALKRGRKVIICDLNPIATEITRLTIKPVNLTKLIEAFGSIEKKVKKKILELYNTQCRKCSSIFPFNSAIWIKDDCIEIRYQGCPECGDTRRGNTKLLKFDKDLIYTIDNIKIKQWYPTNKLYHITGLPFKEKQRYESVDELFTKRNLYALSLLMEAIEKETNKNINDFLKIAFSSMVHLCSKMNPISESGHFTPFSSAWTQHSYWYPSGPFMEQNVWDKFESAIFGHQGLIKAKKESDKYFKNIKFASSFREVIEGDADIFIFHGSCLDLMNKISKQYTNGCIDYIFTDPPYDSSIQYGELSYMWVSWLKLDKNYLNNLRSDEIIHNEKQEKDFEVYHSLLRNSFEGMYDVLKTKSYLTVTFHNPTFKVRNATIRAGVLSGFDLQKIHHQELARPSAKSLLQPFGSAQGDFYLRFYKPDFGAKNYNNEIIDEIKFEKIVLDTTIKIIAERGEPTPYTIIINAIDPELDKRGFFSELNTGLDIKTVLEKHLDKEFILIDTKIGQVKGKLWWFKNPNLVSHLEKTPLSERVESTVLKKLQQKGKVTFTDIWESVSIAFPNSLTSDQTSIKEALEIYAKPIKNGDWLIKQNFKIAEVEREHSTIIAILAEIGINLGYEIYIGKNEQSHQINSIYLKNTGRLDQYLSYKKILKLKNIINPEIIDDIDLLWILNDQIQYLFEIECTTSMTSALQRCSNVKTDVPKIMLFPSDRENQFRQKCLSPLFSERYKSDNWSYILFELLYNAWSKTKNKTDINELKNKTTYLKKNQTENNFYTLFDQPD